MSLDKLAFFFCLLVISIFLSPYYLYPDSAYFLIHDNLDSNIIWYDKIAKSEYFFGSSYNIVPYIFNGIPRGCYPSEYNIQVLLHYFFGPLTAYCVNNIIVHLVAFFGTVLFFRSYILKDHPKYLIYLIALSYALLPFWPSGGIGVAGMPLLLFAFLNVKNNNYSLWDYFIIILFPFYSSFAFSNLFFLISIVGIYLILLILKIEKFNLKLLTAFALFGFLMFAVEYRLFIMEFVIKIQTQRSEFIHKVKLSMIDWFVVSFKHFLLGQYHFYSYHLVTVLFSVIAVYVAQRKDKILIACILAIMFLISLLLVSNDVIMISKTMQIFKLKNTLQLRFYALYPLLSVILLAYIVKVFYNSGKLYLIGVLFVLNILFILILPIAQDYKGSLYVEAPLHNTFVKNFGGEKFSEYYKLALFDLVKKDLPPANFNVMAFGFESQLIQLSGYNTIDGYHYYYPIEKSEMIKKITQPYYDHYLKEKFVAKSRASVSMILEKKFRSDTINNLMLDFDTLKRNNCRYIFSDKPITDTNLVIYNYYQARTQSLFVYKIK